MKLKQLRDFYLDHLLNDLISFWTRFGIDHDNGGYFTCFNNAGDRLTSKNKYIWSQGRFLWMLSRLIYSFENELGASRLREIRDAVESGARFLKEHALLANGNCAWVLDETGHPILTNRDGSARVADQGEPLDLGITADEFLIYGMGECARALDSREYFEVAISLFDSVWSRLSAGSAKSFPHDTPRGYRAHGQPMIMLETANELAEIARRFGDSSAERLDRIALDAMKETLTVFVRRDREVVLEGVHEDGTPAYDEMLGSYYNPGHSLEDAWFIMHFAGRIGERDAVKAGTDIVRWMTSKAWDGEYGGLPQFLHVDGGQPRGRVADRNKGEHMLVELAENWSNKLWWVHSEALYALILAYEQTGDRWFLDTHERFHDYVFTTFPNPRRETGEWIQIRDREGRPEEKVVALPVKDPYHITRAIMHTIKSLERIMANE
ncbi:MAG TPA: AGE family epimerase/isomerase [Spirochaetia bacterium]|nr:AGE family epimerase/isomerase [Spirochaetia bacterium]